MARLAFTSRLLQTLHTRTDLEESLAAQRKRVPVGRQTLAFRWEQWRAIITTSVTSMEDLSLNCIRFHLFSLTHTVPLKISVAEKLELCLE